MHKQQTVEISLTDVIDEAKKIFPTLSRYYAVKQYADVLDKVIRFSKKENQRLEASLKLKLTQLIIISEN